MIPRKPGIPPESGSVNWSPVAEFSSFLNGVSAVDQEPFRSSLADGHPPYLGVSIAFNSGGTMTIIHKKIITKGKYSASRPL